LQNNKKLRGKEFASQQKVVLDSHDLGRAKIEFWDNGIAYIHFLPETEVDIDLAIRVLNVFRKKQVNTNPFFVMIEMGKYSVLTKEARELAYSNEGLKLNRVSAIIVHSLAQRLMVKLMAEFKAKHAIKVSVFKNPAEAEQWLLTQKK
jgi:hypothetical protein